MNDELSREHQDLLQALGQHRYFLRSAAEGLTDEQARLRPTKSELCVGGTIKHVTAAEAQWAGFMTDGPEAMSADGGQEAWAANFEMGPDETLASIIERYDEVARRTDELVRGLPDLDVDNALPPAPWFKPGARWSHRRVLLHIIAETSQHAGHADIIRETIDGTKSMG